MSDPRLTPGEQKARSRRNVAIGLALAAFVALVFVVTMVRLAQNAANHPGAPGIVAGSDRDG